MEIDPGMLAPYLLAIPLIFMMFRNRKAVNASLALQECANQLQTEQNSLLRELIAELRASRPL